MNKNQLEREVAALRRECSRLEQENAAMERDINAICTTVQSASYALARTRDSAAGSLENSTNVIALSEKTLTEITAEQGRIELLYRDFKNVETAQKRIRELNNKLYTDFSTFVMIRRFVRAFIDNISLDIVRPEMIFKSVEKEHLQSPDFWLSCAMLAIMHWKNEDRNAAQRALQQAMKQDDRQTTLFFMTFNLLLGRKDAALQWFDYYQHTEKTGDDAGVILLLLHATNLGDKTGDPFTKRIKDYLFREYNKSKPMNNAGELIETIKKHLVQCNSSETFEFNALRNYLKDYSTMASVLSMAKDNAAVLDYVETTNCSSRDRGFIYIDRFMSEILDAPDKKERAYTDEIAYNELIIKHTGNLTEAQKEFNQQHQHAVAPLNLMRECVDWLFGTGLEFSELARYNMFILCRELIEKAAKKYFEEYRSKHKMVHPATIKDYSTTMDFNNESAEFSKVEEFYRQKRASQLATVKNTSIILCIIFAALCFVGGIVSLLFNGRVEGNALLVLMGFLFVITIILVICAIANHFGNKKKRRNIIASTEASLENAKKIIDTLINEHSLYIARYTEHDRVADDILAAINR